MVARGEYRDALTLWQGAQADVDPFLYWHNLGTVQRHLGNYPQARLAFEKARMNTIYSSATSQQLDLLSEQLPADGQSETWRDHVNSGLLYLGPVKVWLLCLLLLVPFVWIVKTSQASKRFVAACVLIALLPLSFALWFQLSTSAFVTLSPVEIFDGPSKIFKSGRTLPAGFRIMARTENGWWHVIYPPAAVGWLPQEQGLRTGALWGME